MLICSVDLQKDKGQNHWLFSFTISIFDILIIKYVFLVIFKQNKKTTRINFTAVKHGVVTHAIPATKLWIKGVNIRKRFEIFSVIFYSHDNIKGRKLQMEELFEKLRTKPIPKSFEQVSLFFKKNTADLGDTVDDKVGQKPALILDERHVYETLNRRDIIQQVLERRNAQSVIPFEPIAIQPDDQDGEDGQDSEDGQEEFTEDKQYYNKEKNRDNSKEDTEPVVRGFNYAQSDEDTGNMDEEPTEIQMRIHHGRLQKDIASPNEDILQDWQDRLPIQDPIKIRLSRYYLNNRKIIVEKLAKFFEPRKAEYIEASSEASCEKQKQADKLELLTHQKIVRDYLNLVTPYRGLLLYFGLGAGKTCSSIAIAEGLKSAKEVVLLTPASLRSNFFTELKKCGDPLIKVNQYWEFIHTEGQPDLAKTLSAVLSLDQKWIYKNKGAWLMDIHQKANFANLSQKQQVQIQEQLDEMIAAKYISINYNANNIRKKIEPLTLGGTVNPFDNKVVIIDEAHNFVSKIVNKLNYSKAKRLPKTTTENVAYQLYTYLMSAIDARVVLLTGTPVINAPNEIAVLFNILRGYIQQWEIPISPEGQQIISKTDVANLLAKNVETNVFDYLDVRANNTVVITRNPFGFVNVSHTAPVVVAKKVEKEKVIAVKAKTAKIKPIKEKTGKTRKNKETGDLDKPVANGEDTADIVKEYYYEDVHKGGEIEGGGILVNNYVNNGVELNEAGNIDDQAFIQRVLQVFTKAKWHPSPLRSVKRTLFTALPDNSEEFNSKFVDLKKLQIKNKTVFQKRILGLTSFFKSEQENLLPRLIVSSQGGDYFVQRVPMSDHQFGIYAEIRKEEASQEKVRRRKTVVGKEGSGSELFSSTYRIYSRAACNFVFPDGMVRPRPQLDLKYIVVGGGDEDEDEDDNQNNEENDDGEAENEKVEDDNQDSENELLEPNPVVKTRKPKAPKAPREPKAPKAPRANKKVAVVNEDDNEDEEQAEMKLEDLNDTEYAQKIAEALETLKMNPEYLSPAGLKTNSPKFLEIMKKIKNPDHLGKHLVYSQFRHLEGIAILKLVLEKNGFAQFRIFKKATGDSEWGIVSSPPEDETKPKFILYTGTESAEEKEVLLNIYNGNWNLLPKGLADTLSSIPDGNNNIYGKVIQVIMITQSGAEGINLKNTRYVHIVEPYWNMVRCSQVVGRARRICSHTDLPKELQTVQVFLYMTVFSEEQKSRNRSGQGNKELELRDVSKREKDGYGFLSFTTDQTLFENAQMKDEINQQFLQAVKETSIDCSVYNEEDASQCFTFKNPNTEQVAFHPDIQQDENEISEIVKVKKKMVGFQNKYAIESNYKDNDENTLYDLEAYKRGKLEAVGVLRKTQDGQFEIILN